MDSNYRNECLLRKYESYELEDKIESLKSKNEVLKSENLKMKKTLKHFKSSKAFKIWNRYSKVSKDCDNTDDIKYIDEIKVALISDQFTHDSFKYEFEIVEISPDNWLSQFENNEPDLFFCESTWHGYCNGENGVWSGKIQRIAGEEENRQILFEILDYCRANNIPTIFWNKEDPVYYSSDGEFFTDTASRFDYLFTSAEEVVDNYKKEYNHKNVHTLMFAGQPKLFNPMNISDDEISEVVFAGSYYKHHEERVKNMDLIFDKVLMQDAGLKIYDRTYYDNIPHIGYPEKYKKYTVPPIDYKDTSNIYKRLKWAININTITESETMFARRVFELALSNTNIISNYSKGMKNIFKDGVFILEEDNFPTLNEDYEDKRLNNLYTVLENHTYYERWKYILDTIDFPYKEKRKDVSVIFEADKEDLGKIKAKFDKLEYNDKKLVLISNSKLNEDIEIYQNINEAVDNLKSKYYIVADTALDDDFIKNAILHYKYLNKNYGIKKGKNKFRLDITNDNLNVLFNRKMNNANNSCFDIYII